MISHPSAPAATRSRMVWPALLCVWIVWGSTYFAIRIAVETMPPFLMAGVRFLISGLILLALARRVRHERSPLSGSHWKSAVIVGAGLLLGGNGGVVFAEQKIPSGFTALMVSTVPIWLALLSRVFHGNRLRPLAVGGIVAGIAGMALLTLPGGGGLVLLDPLSTLALVVAPLSWAAGSLYSIKADLPKEPWTSAAIQMIGGAVLLLIASIASREPARFDLGAIDSDAWIAFAYLLFAGSLLGFTAYLWLLRNADTTLVGTYAYVNPVVAVLLGWAFLGESLTLPMVLAAAIVVSSVAAIVMSAPKPATPTDAPVPDRDTGENRV